MGRKPKDAGKVADELIKARSVEVEDPPDPDPLEEDEPEAEPPENEFDLSSLDEPGIESEDGKEQERDWEHMYSVLQGKYNTETERLSGMLSQVMGEVQQLKQSKPQSSDGSNVPTEDNDLVKLKAEYPSLYDGLLALVKKEATGIIKATDAKVDGVIYQNAKTQRELYIDNLSKFVPGWDRVNSHPSFLNWLSIKDRYTGVTRQSLLTNAFNRMDVETTAKFFQDFMDEKGIKNRGTSRDDSDQIAPNTSNANVIRSADKSGSITRAVINKFYSEKARGTFQGSEEDAGKFEARIMQAIKDGKVVR